MNTLTQTSQEVKSKQHSIIEVLEFCKVQNLPARIVGRWVWIKFESKPDAEVRQSLKDFGFRWSRRRGQWAHNCGRPSKPTYSYKPWERYQTISIDEYAGLPAGLAV